MKTMLPPETKNVTVEILNIQEKEKQHFDTWFKNAVVLDPLITSDLTEFYKSYVDYVIFTYQIVPLSKKNFSKVLKNELSDWTNQLKVKIHSKSKLQFEGLKLKILKN